MDGISRVSAVIALGGFVATTIQHLTKFIKDVAKAPKEILGLVRYLEDFKRQPEWHRRVHPIVLFRFTPKQISRRDSNAVEYCADIIKSIEMLINKIKGTRSLETRLQKKLPSLKYVLQER